MEPGPTSPVLKHDSDPSTGQASVARFLQVQSPEWIFTSAFVLVVVVGIIDYLTGYEIDFYPFYSLPILLAACFGHRSAAVAIVLLSTLAWWWADTASGHIYTYKWLPEWELLARMMFFCLALIAGWSFRRYRDMVHARVKLLEKSRQLEGEIISISERERQRIGRDLHDGLCQYLAAISFSADWLRRDLHGGIPSAHARRRARS